jgi:hypothetical protein
MTRFGDEAEFRTFLTLAAGRAGLPELTLPVMTRIASDPDSPPQNVRRPPAGEAR